MAAVVLGAPSAPQAASIAVDTVDDEVNTDGDCSLREAVQAANTDTAVDGCSAGLGADTITLPAGTYSLATVGTSLVLSTEVTVEGADATTTIIEAAGSPGVASFRVLDVEAAATATLRHLTIRHGVSTAFSETDYCGGGGIVNRGALLIEDSVITDNQTAYRNAGLPAFGGGICSSGPITLTRCAVEGNQTAGSSSGSGPGGGIATRPGGVLVATELTVSGNTTADDPSDAGYGGGLDVADGATLTDCTIINNSAGSATNEFGANDGGNGGGIFVHTPSPVTIERTLIAGNSAGDASGWDAYGGNGGGVWADAELTLRNCTITGNSSGSATSSTGTATGGKGGGFYHQVWRPVLVHSCTITNNTAGAGTGATSGTGGNGGGIQANQPDPGDQGTEIRSTIIAGNTVAAGGTGPDCEGELSSSDYNLVQDTTGCSIIGTTTNNVTGQDPLLGALADNGGPTETHAVTSSSPAFDVVPSGTNGCGDTLSVDQRGAARPQGSGCEIGAFEVGPVPVELQSFVIE
jgi:CSLREA domain-containing protein